VCDADPKKTLATWHGPLEQEWAPGKHMTLDETALSSFDRPCLQGWTGSPSLSGDLGSTVSTHHTKGVYKWSRTQGRLLPQEFPQLG
jgi:hypothetical protein